MVFTTKHALSDDLVNEVEQNRYSLLFAKLDGDAPFSGYMCILPGGEKRHIKQARWGSVTWFSLFLID